MLDSDLKSLRRVRTCRGKFNCKKHNFETCLIFLKSTCLKKIKLFLKGSFWKNFCTQKITFSLSWPCKMRKFCDSHAILKSTIFKKTAFLKSVILKVKLFLTRMILNELVFVKSMISNEFFSSCHILNAFFFALSEFELKFWQRVRFQMNFSSTRQILNWVFYSASDFECTSIAVCQVLMCSIKEGSFR